MEFQPEIKRHRRPALPAEDIYTCNVPHPEPYTVFSCRQLLEALDKAHVPPGAIIQWGHPQVFVHWRREVV